MIFFTLSYSSKNPGCLFHQRVSPPLKKTPWYVIRGQCCPCSRVWQPSADSNGSLAPFFLFEFKLSGSGVVGQTAITICRGLSHPTRSLSRIVCRGQQHPKAEKAPWGLISRPVLDLEFIFKKPMSPQDTGRQLWGNPGIVSLRQFRDNGAWIQLGQESPLMNKKGLTRNTRLIHYIKLCRLK